MGLRLESRSLSVMSLSNEQREAPQPQLDQIHLPVMLEPVIELLRDVAVRPGAVIVDATLGMGGHTKALLENFPEVRVIGLDRDLDALTIASKRLAPFADRVTFVHAVYDELHEVLQRLGIDYVDGILFDLGVSSLQLDEADRGFAYAQDAPLDMRMNQSDGQTAAEILSSYSEGELRRIFEKFGEEKLAGRYARAIIAARQEQAITRTSQLVQILSDATPAALRDARHPAKRVFQALRIEVNEELSVLARAIPAAIESLAVHGRIVFLAYHSLEDRMVKREFAALATSSAPAGLPVELPEHKPQLKLLTKGAVLADQREREKNPRSIPVRMRAAERIRPAS